MDGGAAHRVDITESFSTQFPTWVFNFGPYGQRRVVRVNSSIMLKTLESGINIGVRLFSFENF